MASIHSVHPSLSGLFLQRSPSPSPDCGSSATTARCSEAARCSALTMPPCLHYTTPSGGEKRALSRHAKRARQSEFPASCPGPMAREPLRPKKNAPVVYTEEGAKTSDGLRADPAVLLLRPWAPELFRV